MKKILLILTLAALAAPVLAGAATVGQSPMESHPSDPRRPGGSSFSWLYRNDDGIAIRISTTGLDEAAYTVWWVIFNHPEYCATLPCTPADLPGNGGDLRIEASVLYATGDFVDRNGNARFAAGLPAGETKNALWGPGLLEPYAAEVHVLVRSHGPIDPETAHLQVTTPGGGCPAGGCRDQQMSIHLP